MLANNSSQQIKYGAILSYLLIFLNTLYGLVVTPYLLHTLGDSSYGVYKSIGAFTATLLVLDLGIGATVMRYTAKYRAEKNNDAVGNFAAMALIESLIMCGALLVFATIFYVSIDSLYTNSFTPSELSLSKGIFIVSIATMMLTLIDNVLFGLVSGAGRFVFANGLKIALVVGRVVLLIACLSVVRSAMVLVGISLLLAVLSVGLQWWYIGRKLGIRIRLHSWDKALFKESFIYTALMFIQSLAVQANGNIDNIAIGAIMGSAAVAVYSFAIQLFVMFEQLAMSFSNLMLPRISNKIAQGASDGELQQEVTRIGRLQFALLMGAMGGFAVIGKEFVTLWLGKGYSDVYNLSLIMMVPTMLALIQNVNLSILRAKNLMGFRTQALVCSAVFNIIITVVGTRLYGYYAAAIGTALSTLLFSVVVMNVYYHRTIGFRVGKFYLDVFKGILPCAIAATLALLFIDNYIGGHWLSFIIKACMYLAAYATLLMLWGLDKTERMQLLRR